MLPTSVRRVVSVSPAPLVSSLSASTPRAATAIAGSRPVRHQRRCSSSKPSSSDNDPKAIAGQSTVPASTSSRSGESKSSGEKRKRKSKDTAERNAAAAQKLPSVPSTQHVSQEALGLSTFFSLHRPISVTHSVPKSITEEAFASIFNNNRSKASVTEVLSTLSRSADELDGAMAKMTISEQPEADANGDPVRKIEVKHPDGTQSSVYVQLNAMAGEYSPFRPPPAPQAQTADSLEASADLAVQEAFEEAPQHRVYKALFTIEESTDSEGQVRVVAHSPEIVQDRPTRRLRQAMFDEAQGSSGIMQAISVKRQRRLKMKKKKLKQLRKRTRNLRRKLDRI